MIPQRCLVGSLAVQRCEFRVLLVHHLDSALLHIMVLICTSSVTNVEHLSTCLLAICTPCLEKRSFKSFPHFLIGLSFNYWAVRVLYVSFIYTGLFHIYDLQYFLPGCRVSFDFLDSVLWSTNVFNFDKAQLLNLLFHCLCKTLIQGHKDLLLCFLHSFLF